MQFEFSSDKKMSFITQEHLPDNYSGIILPGAIVHSYRGNIGEIILQQIQESKYILQYNFFHFLERFSLRFSEKKIFLQTFLAVKNDIEYHIRGLGKFNLKQGQFMVLHGPKAFITSHFEKDLRVATLEAYYTREIVDQLAEFIPPLSYFLKQNEGEKIFFIGQPGVYASPEAREIASEILHSPFDEAKNKFYFDHKLREYLFLLLASTRERPPRQMFTQDELAILEKVKVIVTSKLGEHYTISELAREVGMGEFKLKHAFKKIYGVGIFEYQLHDRMREAKRLLEETDMPIKRISVNMGYKYVTSFITAFRQYHGYPPSTLRNK
jgi:AraC-like DNA-binding protein